MPPKMPQERRKAEKATNHPSEPQNVPQSILVRSGGILKWSLDPVERENPTYRFWTWESCCGNFQLVRLEGKEVLFTALYKSHLRGNTIWDVFEKEENKGLGYPRYYPSLEKALEVLEKYLQTTSENKVKFLLHNSRKGLTCALKQRIKNHVPEIPKLTLEEERILILLKRVGPLPLRELLNNTKKSFSLILKMTREGKLVKRDELYSPGKEFS